ncbi:MAG: acetyl-CoA carboxylase biotin carboxyl carrier protein [Planctomycetes bacterium]|nr:acetyl-CoA carboxylase biotin carboxyl carrier protein [Planctomycetota bacterium]
MDIKFIRDLTRLMRDNDLVELEVEGKDIKVKLGKAHPQEYNMIPAQQQMMAPAIAAAPIAPAEAAAPAAATEDFSACKEVTSPIPGTVYLKPNPESELYTKVGAQVNEDDVVCLVEAMKVFNEIKCEGVNGTIKKICVEDGQAVEYGTVLFLVS